jgi:hypothetical protein
MLSKWPIYPCITELNACNLLACHINNNVSSGFVAYLGRWKASWGYINHIEANLDNFHVLEA